LTHRVLLEERGMMLTTLAALCEALDCQPGDLFTLG